MKPRTRHIVIGVVCSVPVLMLAILESTDLTFRHTDAFRNVEDTLDGSPAAASLIGAPIKISWPVQGNLQVEGDGGSATYRLSVDGPKSSGMLTAKAERWAGHWRTCSLILEGASLKRPTELLTDRTCTDVVK